MAMNKPETHPAASRDVFMENGKTISP